MIQDALLMISPADCGDRICGKHLCLSPGPQTPLPDSPSALEGAGSGRPSASDPLHGVPLHEHDPPWMAVRHFCKAAESFGSSNHSPDREVFRLEVLPHLFTQEQLIW